MSPGKFVTHRELKPFSIAPGVTGRSAWDGNVMLTFVEFDPNCKHGTHSHTFEQAGIVLSGQMHLQIGNEVRLVKREDAYIIPAGVEHSAYTAGSPCVSMEIFTPPREEYKRP